MQFSRHSYLTPEQILFEATANVADTDFKKIHRGFYESQIQHCLEEFDLVTLWKENRVNLIVDKQGSAIELPKGTFNVKEVYGYCGELGENGQMTKLWHKDNFYSEGGRVVAKNRRDGSRDPFYAHNNDYFRAPFTAQVGHLNALGEAIYYYNVENGVLMYSSNVRRFDKLHVRFTGFTVPFGEVPLVPQFLRTAVVDYVSEAAARVLMVDNPQQYGPIYRVYAQRLDKDGFNGSWYTALAAARKMDQGEKNDYAEYLYRWTYRS